MGFVSAMASCVACHRAFTFNPMLVPSVIVDGSREPVCRDCVERANVLRAAKRLPVFLIHPGSYDPIDEAEMEW